MPWQFWLGLILGIVVGGTIGFAIGRLVKSSATIAGAAAEVERVDATADEKRRVVEDDLKDLVNGALKAGGKELEDALNEGFQLGRLPASLPADHPMLDVPRKPSERR